MRRITPRHLPRVARCALVLGLGGLTFTSAALAQEPTPAEPTAEASEAPPAAPTVTAATATSEPAATEAPSLKDELDALKAQVEELKQRQEEAETAALLAEEPEIEEEKFRIYGFMDMGLQRYFTNDNALVAAVFDTNAATFVTGNIDLYFDFNPHRDWRALAEIRFTNAPQGNIVSYGGLGGTFERVNTEQFDPNGTAANAPVWGSYAVIERAYIEWHRHQSFQLLVGNFFTPFGIWLVDHGSPTLISIALPQFLQQKYVPLRQTGVQALGSFFAGDYEIAYRAWVTNGRTEENPFDYDDDKGFGGRVFVRRDTGDFNFQVGASYQFDHVRDKVVNITGFAPVRFAIDSTWDYDEHIVGADVSVDIGATRVRLEGIARRQDWWDGKVQPLGSLTPGAYNADRWQLASYLVVAHQLPWWGLEPYFYGEILQQPWLLADGLGILSGGLNVRFTPSTMLKLQASQSLFFNARYTTAGDPSLNDVTTLISRLVVAF